MNILLQGLDAHRGPEKERIIFETAFRSVQADRPDPADASSASPDRATLHVPARAVAARAAQPQPMGDLRRGGARFPQHRRGLQRQIVRPLAPQAHNLARMM